MPWTIPNQLLHDKPVPPATMRTRGRRHVFVCCSNPDCHHNAEWDVSRLPDDVTFNDLQPRMLCTACDHRGADEPIQPLKGKKLATLKHAAAYIMALPKPNQQAPEWHAAIEALLMAAEDRGPLMHAHVGMMLAVHGAKPIPEYDSSKEKH